VITRIFDAPIEDVWKAWVECDHLKNWWGPKGFTSPSCKNDFRVGGKYLYAMRGGEDMGEWSGKTTYSTGVYREIVPMKRIVSIDSFADEKGNVVPATHYGMIADFPLEMQVTVTFKESNGKTKLTLRHVSIPAGKDMDNAKTGWSESLDKLHELLNSKPKHQHK
jgi:uncharacterized protein YndB with AHSA1/START domain